MSCISHCRFIGLMAAAVVTVSCADSSTSPLTSVTAPARASASRGVSDFVAPASIGWQEQARTLVGANKLSPLAAARVYAAVSVAQYQAVAAIDDHGKDGEIRENGVGHGGRSALEAQRGAVAGASAQVLSFFFPAAAASLEQLVETEGNATPGNVNPQFTRGLATGRSAGDNMVARLRADHFTAPFTGTVPVGPGLWIANGPPAGATFGGVTPYFLTSGDQFRPAPPPAFGSTAYLTDLHEIRALSDGRTPAQLAIALYWNFPTGTFTPPGYWDRAASDYIVAHALDERAATRTFALTNAAQMDALIGCFDAKYTYWMIRPPQADPGITLTFPVPNHPSYPSAHSCVSAAAATVLGAIFPDRTAELNGWVTEAGLSRMYAGIHYRFDITAGRNLGEAVGRWALAHANRIDPVIARPRHHDSGEDN
jgi:membrane-associated phospholipid phosphatase